MLHLVIGNTGPVGLGREICRILSGDGRSVRALVRPTSNPERVAELASMGVELCEGDLKDRASMDRACEGVSAVLTSATTTLCRQPDDTIEAVDRNGYVNLVEAAAAAGVRQFVYTSYSKNTQKYADCPLTDAKLHIEDLVKRSGFESYTILRPSYFTECWIGPNLHFDITEHKALIYGAGHTKICWISTRDVARFAVASLTNPAGRNATLELGGPDALSPLEIVAMCEDIGQCKFTVEHVSEADLERERVESTNSLDISMAALKLGYARGDMIAMDELLPQFPEMELMVVKDYVQSMLGG